jgi:excisionase family DNA binding protein
MTLKPLTSAPGQAGAEPASDLGPLLHLQTAIEAALRPLRAELEGLRAVLQGRRKSHYTVEEVAELTGRTPYTVRRWVTEKRIKAIRLSGTGPKGRLLIPREELDALISAGLGAEIPDAVVE